VKTHSIMKPKDAARIFNNLPDEVLVPVARDMKSDQLALVLASMNPDNAKALTIKLANRLVLPQATDAAPAATLPAPSATAAGPAPMPAAAKAPVAGQNPATPKT
jgi:flagellar motility protein MotE (MotC chaperone)